VRSYLDDKLRQRCLLLLSKICKARRIVPTSYVLQQELISVGRVFHQRGFTEVSSGEYLRFPVAIKRLKLNEGDSDSIFKVPLINLAHHHCSCAYLSLSGYVERSSVGNTCRIRTYSPC